MSSCGSIPQPWNSTRCCHGHGINHWKRSGTRCNCGHVRVCFSWRFTLSQGAWGRSLILLCVRVQKGTVTRFARVICIEHARRFGLLSWGHVGDPLSFRTPRSGSSRFWWWRVNIVTFGLCLSFGLRFGLRRWSSLYLGTRFCFWTWVLWCRSTWNFGLGIPFGITFRIRSCWSTSNLSVGAGITISWFQLELFVKLNAVLALLI